MCATPCGLIDCLSHSLFLDLSSEDLSKLSLVLSQLGDGDGAEDVQILTILRNKGCLLASASAISTVNLPVHSGRHPALKRPLDQNTLV